MKEPTYDKGNSAITERILYICNRQKCHECCDECRHTSDIRYAKNFDTVYMNDVMYIEMEDEDA